MSNVTIDDDKLVTIGQVSTVFGVKGWVKISSYTQPVGNLLAYDELYIKRAGTWQLIEFDAGHPQGKGLVAHISGCDDREQARSYAQTDIAVAKEALASLDCGDYYWHQLEGLEVYVATEEGGKQLLGRVDHLMETGSNDVLVVRACKGSIDDRERLIPYRPDEVVREIDLDKGCLIADWDPEF